MTTLRVTKPGLRATLQDEGRQHSQHLGLAPGGVADLHAWHWANKLLDNPPHGACVEVLLGQFEAIAEGSLSIAVTGASTQACINGEAVGNWQTHHLSKGDRLTLTETKSGLINYIAVSGGWQGDTFCNSRSMTPREGLAGFTVIGEDTTLTAAREAGHPKRFVPAHFIPDYTSPLVLRVVPSYQYHCFDNAAKAAFTQQLYAVSDRIDRMGYRLSGPALDVPNIQLLSEGIALGAVQVPADGQPIVLLNDRQTIGGYPKIGTVAALDCSKLSQRGPGTDVRFAFADLADIQGERMIFEAFFAQTGWTDDGKLIWR
ncbi:5-oxoprolinase subunit C family protein [Marinobacter fonticola]|uniref:5-oxoprolinase subunit C family protein n=1 Tax=Marinobacter fonticola TaxID=2603215 RepID=UPI0011E66561|nr:biotin-dependent carboxyltransferase family protein [Marinobacter fonticola]